PQRKCVHRKWILHRRRDSPPCIRTSLSLTSLLIWTGRRSPPPPAAPPLSAAVPPCSTSGPASATQLGRRLPLHTSAKSSQSSRTAVPGGSSHKRILSYRSFAPATHPRPVTKTDTDWFRSSPFRIDLLEHKDTVAVPIKHPERQIKALEGLTLTWILIDTLRYRAANLSSIHPVTVQYHWFTGEIQARFASIVTAGQGHVQCGIVVTCASSSGDQMQVKEVRLEIEDIDGKHLTGNESLAVLEQALTAEKGKVKTPAEEARRRYREFEEMRRGRREKMQRREGALDTICAVFGVLIFAAFLVLICM
ncbi:probable F-box protein At2g36090, partial [Andrographis paniculata]|uniref:probable F-box protein At2g36090 n=1 Tax=Andrographis paniculata TaxID=175694 RepID=UPI0021E923E3